jgi:hypothetical protein
VISEGGEWARASHLFLGYKKRDMDTWFCRHGSILGGAGGLHIHLDVAVFLYAIISSLFRVETKIFVCVFSRKFRENLFSFLAKKSYENIRK